MTAGVTGALTSPGTDPALKIGLTPSPVTVGTHVVPDSILIRDLLSAETLRALRGEEEEQKRGPAAAAARAHIGRPAVAGARALRAAAAAIPLPQYASQPEQELRS